MRILRHVLQIVLLLITIVIGVAAAFLIASQTAWFRGWLRGVAERQANKVLNGQLAIGNLRGNLFGGISLHGVRVEMNGRPAVSIGDIAVQYNLLELLGGHLVVGSVRLDHPVIQMERQPDGRLNLSSLLRPRPKSNGPSKTRFEVDNIQIVNGEVSLPPKPVGTTGETPGAVAPHRMENLDADVSISYAPSGLTADIRRLSFRGLDPAFDLQHLAGTVRFADGTLFVHDLSIKSADSSLHVDGSVLHPGRQADFSLRINSDGIDFAELGRLIPTLSRFALNPALDVDLKGPLTAMRINFGVHSGAAGLQSGNLLLDALAPDHHLSGTVRLRNFDLHPLLPPPSSQHSDVTGSARFSIGFVKRAAGTDIVGSYTLNAERAWAFGYGARNVTAVGRIAGTRLQLDSVSALAYGAQTTTAGAIALPHNGRPVGYDLHGHAAGVDLRLIPATLKMPRVPSDFELDYQVAGTGSVVSGSAAFNRSMFTGATIENGTTGTFSYDGDLLQYSGDGRLAHFDLQRFGRDFEIQTLTEPRFASDINGNFRVSGSGTTLERLQLKADGVARNSMLLGTHFPASPINVTIANRTLEGHASGAFGGLNPEFVTTGLLPRGQLNGRFDLAVGLRNLGVGTSLVDDLSLTGNTQLQLSVVGGLHLAHAEFDGRYANRAFDFKRLNADGPSLKLNATGPLALNATDQSHLAYHVETANLQGIGQLLHQPLSGGGVADGLVSGNARQLALAGTLRASNARYGGAQALELRSEYNLAFPELDVNRTTGTAKSSATFVELAGWQINQLTATTTFGNERLDFDAEARQPQRQVTVRGDLLLHPQHQEVHLERLNVQSGKATWQIAEGSHPALNYGGGTIGVNDMRLVSADQSIWANGTIGRTASDLRVKLSNVRLSNIDALMLTDRQINGVLNAQAALTGPSDALRGDGEFTVSHGAFRQFTYQSLAGHFTYQANRIGVNARMDENPHAWIAVDGSVPTALFAANPTAAAGAAPVDLRVRSSQLDLGFVQGFTTEVRNVTGGLAIDAYVSGTAANPRPGGTVTIANGAFMVVPTGVLYHNATAQFVLHPDHVTVQALTLSDPEGRTLNVTGDLGVGLRQLGTAKLHTTARSFQVVNNEFGQVDVDLDLGIDGNLRQPRFTGTTAIHSGRVDVDRLIAMATMSPYSTSPTTVQPTAATPILPAQPADQPPEEETLPPLGASGTATSQPSGSSWLDAATFDLRVPVPGDLVAKGTDIRVGQNPISLGQVSVTLGGDLHIQKAAQQPVSLVGTIRLLNGSYQFQGRRFDIVRGSLLRFEGTRRINPALDISATRIITGVETTVHLTGTLRRPQLTLTSDPPLDQADILSLIIFGQPVNQLAAGQQASLAQQAAAIASGFVTSRLAQSIGNVLNLDTFEIRTEQTAGQFGATVTLGEQFGQRVYIRLEQGVGVSSATQFVLDYQLTRFLRLETTVSQGESALRNVVRRIDQSGADLIFFFSF